MKTIILLNYMIEIRIISPLTSSILDEVLQIRDQTLSITLYLDNNFKGKRKQEKGK